MLATGPEPGRIMARPAERRRSDGGLEYATLSDERLAQDFLAGDSHAFEVLVTRYSRTPTTLPTDSSGTPKTPTTSPRSCSSRSTPICSEPDWISRCALVVQIARNKAIDLLRARRQVVFSDLSVGEDDPPIT